MNPFEIALSLLGMCFGFGIVAFAIFWLSTDPRIQTYSKLDVMCSRLCQFFLALSAVSGALAVVVVTAALVAPFTGVVEL